MLEIIKNTHGVKGYDLPEVGVVHHADPRQGITVEDLNIAIENMQRCCGPDPSLDKQPHHPITINDLKKAAKALDKNIRPPIWAIRSASISCTVVPVNPYYSP